MPQSSRGDRQRETGCQIAEQLAHAGKDDDAALDERAVVNGLALDEQPERVIIQRATRAAMGSLEAAAVVHPKVMRVIVRFRERNSFFLEHFFKRVKVNSLVVDNYAIKIKDDRAQHAPRFSELGLPFQASQR